MVKKVGIIFEVLRCHPLDVTPVNVSLHSKLVTLYITGGL